MVIIGGHQGLDVIKENGAITKHAHNTPNIEGIHNEARMLRKLSGTGFAPELLEEGGDYIIQEDLGESQPVESGEVLRRNAVWLLWTLRQHRISHGDLTNVNTIIKDDRPVAIDFQQSRFFDEEMPDKRKCSDSYYLWRTIAGVPARQHPPDCPRVIRRWYAVLGALEGFALGNPLEGMSLLDLGCFHGDFCAMAAAEGMVAHGIDQGGFRSGEDSIAEANIAWADMAGKVRFSKQNILDCDNFHYDAVLLFSTWAYIYRDFGREQAFMLLERIMAECGTLFFETQLNGDGPGLDFLVTDDDVASMLGRFGTLQLLVTIPVTGRPASRAVWKVTKQIERRRIHEMVFDWAHPLVDTQPGFLLHKDVDLIQKLVGKLPKDRSVRIVELGASNGVTTLSALCARSEDVTVITIGPSKEALRWPEVVATNIGRHKDWQPLIADPDMAAGKIKDGSVDLLLVDTHPSYSRMKSILKDFLPKIRKDGFIWLHDYDDRTRLGEPVNFTRAPGVKRVVDEAVKAGVLEEVETKGRGWAGRVSP